jgi:hypothetical protein
LRVEDDALAGFGGADDGALDGGLVAEEGAETGLDEAGGKGEDDDGELGSEADSVPLTIKGMYALPVLMTAGIVGTIRKAWAKIPTSVPTQMVLNRPHLASATIAPAIGMT